MQRHTLHVDAPVHVALFKADIATSRNYVKLCAAFRDITSWRED